MSNLWSDEQAIRQSIETLKSSRICIEQSRQLRSELTDYILNTQTAIVESLALIRETDKNIAAYGPLRTR